MLRVVTVYGLFTFSSKNVFTCNISKPLTAQQYREILKLIRSNSILHRDRASVNQGHKKRRGWELIELEDPYSDTPVRVGRHRQKRDQLTHPHAHGKLQHDGDGVWVEALGQGRPLHLQQVTRQNIVPRNRCACFH